MIHIRDDETDRVVRGLAQHLGVSITEAVKLACAAALSAANQQGRLWERTADLREKVGQFPPTGKSADKQFFDDLSV